MWYNYEISYDSRTYFIVRLFSRIACFYLKDSDFIIRRGIQQTIKLHGFENFSSAGSDGMLLRNYAIIKIFPWNKFLKQFFLSTTTRKACLLTSDSYLSHNCWG